MTAEPPPCVADATALLAIIGALPLEPPGAVDLLAPDAALSDVMAVLRSLHEGRPGDVLGDLAVIGVNVRRWLPTFRFAATLTDLAIEEPDELASDLAGVAMADELGLQLVTGLPQLARLHPDTQVLPRRSS